MNRSLILGLSLCLNILLIFIGASKTRRTSAPESMPHHPSPTLRAESPDFKNQASEPKRAEAVTQDLQWSSLHSENLAVYVINLRASGIPERILQNIIVKELDRRFLERKPVDHAHTNFWRTGPDRDAADLERRRAERALEIEKRAKIKEFLGVEWYETPIVGKGEELWMMLHLAGEGAAGNVERLAGVWKKTEDRATHLRNPAVLNTLELEKSRTEAYQETVEELRREFGPTGFEELELRMMAVGVADVWGSEQLFGSVMTGQELRELLRIKKEPTMPLRELFGLDDATPDPELSQGIENRLRNLLGEERYSGYQRAKDPQFRWIRRNLNEPMETTWAIFDIYAGLKESVGQIQDQIRLTPEETEMALRQLRSNAEKSLELAMGPEKFAAYMRDKRDKFGWLDDLTGKEVESK